MTNTFGPSRPTLSTRPTRVPKPDRRIGNEAAGFGEVRRIALSLVEERHLVVVQRGQRHGQRQPDTNGADDERVAFGEGLHRGVHLPESWPATLTRRARHLFR